MEDVHNLINFGPTNPIQILNQHEMFWRFCMCPSNDTFDKNKKILKYVLGLNSKDRKSTRDKANISNPKVNRGCAPLTANRTSADCVQISLGPSITYIPLGVYRTGRFNAMLTHWCYCSLALSHRLDPQKQFSTPSLLLHRWGLLDGCDYVHSQYENVANINVLYANELCLISDLAVQWSIILHYSRLKWS